MKPTYLLMLLVPVIALAGQTEFATVLSDHRFQPETLTVPAGEKIRLVVENRDTDPEEFDSYALNREKVIPGNGKATIYIGPLAPGEYAFRGELHEDTAKGTVVAR
jgi:plastocyanin